MRIIGFAAAAAAFSQVALLVRVDEDPGSGNDEAGEAIKAQKALDEATSEASAAAGALAGAKVKEQADAAKAAEGSVQNATGPETSVVGVAKPKIEFEREESPMKKIIEEQGLKKFDRNGDGTLNAAEFRELVHAENPGDPVARSDADMERLVKTYDKDKDDQMSKEEVIEFLRGNPVAVAREDVNLGACNGWMPNNGSAAMMGASCQKWGWQTSWCFVSKDYNGPGFARMQESEEYKGKFWAPCQPPPVPGAPGDVGDVSGNNSAKEAVAEIADAMMKAEGGEEVEYGYEYGYAYDYVEE